MKSKTLPTLPELSKENAKLNKELPEIKEEVQE